MIDPDAVSDNVGEWIELFNTSGTPIDIDGWRLTDNLGSHTIDNGGPLVVPAFGFVVLGLSDNTSVNGMVPVDYVYDGVSLNNGGDAITLFDETNTQIDTVDYTFFLQSSGTSQELRNPFVDNADASTWAEGSSTYNGFNRGTPGQLNDVFAPCFLTGTAIAKPDGATPVEALAIGGLLRTPQGQTVPVKWVGRKTVSTRFGPAERLMPVRVRAGALGDGPPKRDLTLTADHALLIDGMLINAGASVNGSSIVYVPLSELGDSYTVYHVETEAHDIILAEGAPAETYIDHVARRAFDNHAEYLALYGEERPVPEMACPRISSARLVPYNLRARLSVARVA